MYRKIATILAAVTINAFFLCSQTANAEGQVAITVKNPDPYSGNQSWFIYQKKPGEVIEDIATLKNFGNEKTKVKIVPVDATSNTSGSFILKFEHEDQIGIGDWTKIAKDEVEIAPEQRIDVPFRIEIPRDIQPGEYIGGIVVESMASPSVKLADGTSVENTSSSSASVKTRIGTRIYLTIPGLINESFSLDNIRYQESALGTSYFNLKISNKGNTSYDPTAIIEIFDMSGKPYDRIEKPLGTSAPHTVIEPIVPWNKKPFIGKFTAKTTLIFKKRFQSVSTSHAAAQKITKTFDFYFIPWKTIIFSAILFFLSLGYIIYSRASYRKEFLESYRYTVQPCEDIISISKKFNTPWKKIAKLSRLEQPYIIKTGDIVKIPKKNFEKNK